MLEMLRANGHIPKDPAPRRLVLIHKLFTMGDFAFKIIDLSLQKYAFVCYYLPVNCLPELDGKVCMRPYFEKVLEDLQIVDSKVGVQLEQFGGYLSSRIKHFATELL